MPELHYSLLLLYVLLKPLLLHYPNPTQPQTLPDPYPNPTLTLTFWLGVSYYASSLSSLSRLSRLSRLSSRLKLTIYSKTSKAMLILTLTIPTPKFKVKDHPNLNLTSI